MLEGKMEVLVDLQSFRNIDLFEQGYYALRVQLGTDGVQTAGQPYRVIAPNAKYEAWVYDDSFFSRVFEITFNDQFVELDNVCVFRIPYAAYPIRNTKLYMNVQLLFANTIEHSSDPEAIFAQMREIGQFSCSIKDACDGIAQGVEILYNGQNFCVCNAYIHTISVDYKYQGAIPYTQFLSLELQLNEFIANYVDSLYAVQQKYKNILIQGINQISKDKRNTFLQQLMKVPIITTTKYKSQVLQQVSEETQQIINQLGQSLILLWYLFQDVYQQCKIYFIDQIDSKGVTLNKRISQDFVVNRVLNGVPFHAELDANLMKQRESQWLKLKDNSKDMDYSVQDLGYLDPLKISMLFEDKFQLQQLQQQEIVQEDTQPRRHVLVLVHGYQGTSQDMQQWRNYLHLKLPHHLIIISQCNEFDTEGDIKAMGISLAYEVQKTINDKLPQKSRVLISFIGHSLGGVIIRAALPNLLKYQHCMHTYISLASPHLGLGVQQSTLVETGLWFMKAMKKKENRECLDQMTLSDGDNLQNCFMSKLSQNSNMSWFKHVIMCYSYQDQYVPYQSATLTKIIGSNSDRAQLHNGMIDNILSQFKGDKLIKVGVFFPIQKTNLDSMIGRMAHIEFLDNLSFIRLFIDYYYEYLL